MFLQGSITNISGKLGRLHVKVSSASIHTYIGILAAAHTCSLYIVDDVSDGGNVDRLYSTLLT